MSCKICDADTYLEDIDKSSKADCIKCSVERSTGDSTGNTKAFACLCQRTLFYHQIYDDTCEPCLTGADCSLHDGMKLLTFCTTQSLATVQAKYFQPAKRTIIHVAQ